MNNLERERAITEESAVLSEQPKSWQTYFAKLLATHFAAVAKTARDAALEKGAKWCEGHWGLVTPSEAAAALQGERG